MNPSVHSPKTANGIHLRPDGRRIEPSELGYDISLPLTESAAYDLIVDDGAGVWRVQVKFSGDGEVDLRRIHSNSQGYVVKKTRSNAYDWLYVLNGSGEEYLIKQCLGTRRSVKPGLESLLQ